MHNESTLILLFAVATAVALVARRLRVPYTVALVLAGLALGATRVADSLHLSKELLYGLFLPGLLFEAAYHLDFAEFKRSVFAIFALSVPGVLGAIGATASLLALSSHTTTFVNGIGWTQALVFAALIAATDPIAVVALFKSLGAPKRLGVLIEGESLVNDGTSIVVFTIIYGAVTSSSGFSVGAGVLEFVKVSGLGFLVGAAIAAVIAYVIRHVDDPMIEITLTMITAYGSFSIAERLGASGVIATVTAGMVCGSYAAPRAMTPTTRVALESFWEYVAFALNSLVFLLIGAEVRVRDLVNDWAPIVIAFAAVTIGRAVVVFAVSALLRPTVERIPLNWTMMLTWGGLRGALSMVLALAIPLAFPRRDLIVTLTFGVVLLSIVVQGMTAGPLLRWLKLSGQGEPPQVEALAPPEA